MQVDATDEPHDESYFASASDLIIGVLFVFLLLIVQLALNYSDAPAELARLQEENRRLRDEVTELQSRNSELEKTVASFARLLQEARKELENTLAMIEELASRAVLLRRQVLQELKARLDSQGIIVEISPENDVLRVQSDAMFARGQAEIEQAKVPLALAVLRELELFLRCGDSAAMEVRACLDGRSIFETVLIEGHTDTTRQTPTFDNWDLSVRRANAVRSLAAEQLPEVLALTNVSGSQLVGLAGYGESRPLPGVPGEDSKNRRIEVRFVLGSTNDFTPVRDRLNELLQRLRSADIEAALP